MLASVYSDIYSSNPYLYKFDKNISDLIENNTNYRLDREKRTLEMDNHTYHIHDIVWVMIKKHVSPITIKKINSKFK